MSVDLHAALDRTIRLVGIDIFPGISPDAVLNGLVSTRIRITADEQSLQTVAGQTAVVTSFIAVAQLGASIVLDIPDVEIVGNQPPIRPGSRLKSGLIELGCDLLQEPSEEGAADLSFNFGASSSVCHEPALGVVGNGWASAIAVDSTVGAEWVGDAPIGGCLASVMVGAEAFRFAMGRVAKLANVAPRQEHRLGKPVPTTFSLQEFDLSAIDIGKVDSVSAGAMATCALALLLRVPGLEGQMRVIDHDDAAIDNLNRYPLYTRRSVGIRKVDILAALQTSTLIIEPIPVRLDMSTSGEIGLLAPQVIVGVDDIPSRWLAQELAPDWLSVAATSHFEVIVSEHDPAGPCVGCLHPYKDDGPPSPIPTVSFVSAAAGYLLAYRLLRHASGADSATATLGYPLDLAGELSVQELALAPHRLCPVGCEASDLVRSN